MTNWILIVNKALATSAQLSTFEYLVLKAIYNRCLDDVFNTDLEKDILQVCLGSMLEKGVLNNDYSINKQHKAWSLFEEDDTFRALFLLYPVKVTNGTGGTRSLRSASLDSQDYDTCRKKFMLKCKKEDEKKYAYMVTDKFIKMAMTSGKEAFIPALETYINDKHWEKYDYLLNENFIQDKFETRL